MPWPEETTGRGSADDGLGRNADLIRLVAAAADLCRKPLHHAVIEGEHLQSKLSESESSEAVIAGDESLDRCLRLLVRSPEGVRLPEEDLELELYRSGDDLHLTLAWAAFEERPMLWQGRYPVWMDGASGARCERPEQGLPLEALARRLRALLVEPPSAFQ